MAFFLPGPHFPDQALADDLVFCTGHQLGALWILIANARMQHPVGSAFNPATMRMEVTLFTEVFFNPVAQEKFVHTISASYVLSAMFRLSISTWDLLRGRHANFTKRAMTVTASFGLSAALSMVVLLRKPDSRDACSTRTFRKR